MTKIFQISPEVNPILQHFSTLCFEGRDKKEVAFDCRDGLTQEVVQTKCFDHYIPIAFCRHFQD